VIELLHAWHWNPHLFRELWSLGGGFWVGTVLPYTHPWRWDRRVLGCFITFGIWPAMFAVWCIAAYQEYCDKKARTDET
jgi:hypothetical protein